MFRSYAQDVGFVAVFAIIAIALIIGIGLLIRRAYGQPAKVSRRQSTATQYKRSGLELGIQVAALAILGLAFLSTLPRLMGALDARAAGTLFFYLVIIWVPIAALAQPRKQAINIAADIVSALVIALVMLGIALGIAQIQ